MRRWIAMFAVGRRPAIMHQSGLRSPMLRRVDGVRSRLQPRQHRACLRPNDDCNRVHRHSTIAGLVRPAPVWRRQHYAGQSVQPLGPIVPGQCGPRRAVISTERRWVRRSSPSDGSLKWIAGSHAIVDWRSFHGKALDPEHQATLRLAEYACSQVSAAFTERNTSRFPTLSAVLGCCFSTEARTTATIRSSG